MRLLYLLACVCVTVNSLPVNEEETRINGKTGWYIPFVDGSVKWVDMKTLDAVKSYFMAMDGLQDSEEDVETATASSEIKETPINGVNGWYIPFADGSLKWLDMDQITRIQSYQTDIQAAHNSFFDNNDFNTDFSYREEPVKFSLYSTQSPDKGEWIFHDDEIKVSGFNPEHTTIFVAQSFLQTNDSMNINKILLNAFAKKGNYNFISIDWLTYYKSNYLGLSSQVPMAGEIVAALFDTLVENYQMDCKKTHLIGHGLGAHVIGFAAKNIKSCKVPKITALDPALPLFPYDKPDERLNSSDASYVESIQTDAGFYSYEEPVGTTSFYCNGGKQQPGCDQLNACNHERSIKIYAEAIGVNSFPSNKCDNYVSAINGSCNDQYSDVRLGEDNNEFEAQGVFFVKTN